MTVWAQGSPLASTPSRRSCGHLAAPDPAGSEHLDLDEARRLITALAGLLTAARPDLGPHAGPLMDGLKSLQLAFRESSSFPDEPGQGPGEKYTVGR